MKCRNGCNAVTKLVETKRDGSHRHRCPACGASTWASGQGAAQGRVRHDDPYVVGQRAALAAEDCEVRTFSDALARGAMHMRVIEELDRAEPAPPPPMPTTKKGGGVEPAAPAADWRDAYPVGSEVEVQTVGWARGTVLRKDNMTDRLAVEIGKGSTVYMERGRVRPLPAPAAPPDWRDQYKPGQEVEATKEPCEFRHWARSTVIGNEHEFLVVNIAGRRRCRRENEIRPLS